MKFRMNIIIIQCEWNGTRVRYITILRPSFCFIYRPFDCLAA